MVSSFRMIGADVMSDQCLRLPDPHWEKCDITVEVLYEQEGEKAKIGYGQFLANGTFDSEYSILPDRLDPSFPSASQRQAIVDYAKLKRALLGHPALKDQKGYSDTVDYIVDHVIFGEFRRLNVTLVEGLKFQSRVGRLAALIDSFILLDEIPDFLHKEGEAPPSSSMEAWDKAFASLTDVQKTRLQEVNALLQVYKAFRGGLELYLSQFDERAVETIRKDLFEGSKGPPFPKLFSSFPQDQRKSFADVLAGILDLIFWADPESPERAYQTFEGDFKKQLFSPDLTAFAKIFNFKYSKYIRAQMLPDFHTLIHYSLLSLSGVETLEPFKEHGNKVEAKLKAATSFFHKANFWGIGQLIEMPNDAATRLGLKRGLLFYQNHQEDFALEVLDEVFFPDLKDTESPPRIRVVFKEGELYLRVDFGALIGAMKGRQWDVLTIENKRRRLALLQDAYERLFDLGSPQRVELFDRNYFTYFDKSRVEPETSLMTAQDFRKALELAAPPLLEPSAVSFEDPWLIANLVETGGAVVLGGLAIGYRDNRSYRNGFIIGASSLGGAALGDWICRVSGAKRGWEKMLCQLGGGAVGAVVSGFSTGEFLIQTSPASPSGGSDRMDERNPESIFGP